jgi:hypothetical protein
MRIDCHYCNYKNLVMPKDYTNVIEHDCDRCAKKFSIAWISRGDGFGFGVHGVSMPIDYHIEEKAFYTFAEYLAFIINNKQKPVRKRA